MIDNSYDNIKLTLSIHVLGWQQYWRRNYRRPAANFGYWPWIPADVTDTLKNG